MTDYVDVLIVGAGLSGIGAASYLQDNCPQKSFAILESRQSLGGTWDLFRYPGIRSDSDMYTLGYAFKPWTNPKSIADGPSILSYIRETAAERHIEEHIRYDHKVVAASWCSQRNRWRVSTQSAAGDARELECHFLYMCSGYYSYENPHTPTFPGQEEFSGQLFHAQHWPDDLDYRDKKVVVIGSGATAVTLVPEMANTAASVTMLQRSPTYIASVPGSDPWAQFLRKFLPISWVYHITRWKRVLQQMYIYNIARRRPKAVKQYLINLVREELGPDYDVEKHFTPRYNPWEERLCAVPDSDLFAAIRQGRADVVTDHIERFDSSGIVLRSGAHLEADIVVLATGLNLVYMGDVALTVDEQEISPPEEYLYRGMMLSNVPNLAQAFGYTNSSWTLKADLTAEYVCRVLNHMTRTGTQRVVPRVGAEGVEEVPMLDFSSGYIQRSIHQFPRQGSKKPWRLYQNYLLDLFSLRYSSLTNTALEFQ